MNDARKVELLNALFFIFAKKHQASIGESVPVKTLWINMSDAGFTDPDELGELMQIALDGSFAVHTPGGPGDPGGLALTEAGYAASRNV
ncbi:hypothetical protein Q8A64_17475 [Oxalobacteraceae bacterium R-40]|uniref:Uncharacterized protein n=1 Tax=Keguizhuia sedimenti TaxID=3064264 RepID=A0ABU1BT53_9BURK|nr:hypothetical protein [Oxalobacteraceae bacterium R-40]